MSRNYCSVIDIEQAIFDGEHTDIQKAKNQMYSCSRMKADHMVLI